MTDQLNEARPNDALILRPGPVLRPTMEDFRAAMDETERIYGMIHVRRIRMYTDPYSNPFGEDYPGSYCYCSPSRSMFFDSHRGGDYYRDALTMDLDALMMELGNRILARTDPTVTHNEPEPRGEAEPSKELAVTPKPVLDPVEVIPAPKRRALALLSCGALAVLAFIVNVAFVFIR